MVYTVEQIAQRILPIAQKYGLKAARRAPQFSKR